MMKRNYLALLGQTEITGGDYVGFHEAGDLRYRTADGVPYDVLWNEFNATIDIVNQHQNHVVDLFTFNVTQVVERVPNVGKLQFERATEYGVPKAPKLPIDYYELSYGYEDYDLAQRFTWQFLRENNAAYLRTLHNETLKAHKRTIFEEVMTTIFDNRTRTTEVTGLGYNVYPLFNGTGPKPMDYNGVTFNANHTHYLVSGATLLDSEDIEGVIGSLTEHGFGPRTGTRIVFLVPQAVIDVVSTFRKGVANNNSKVAKYDWIPAPSQPAQFTPSADGLLGSQPPDTWNGLIVSGSYGNAWFVEEPFIPSGYILAVASGGLQSATNIVGVRQHENPAWRGLRLMPGNQTNYPLIEGFYQFGFGTGIRQRGGATVMQIKTGANADYTPPADFTHETL